MNGACLRMGGALLGALVLGSRSAPAEDAAASTLDELSRKVNAIERKMQVVDETASVKTNAAAVVSIGKDGFSVSSADRAFQLRVRGYAQVDSGFYLNDSQDKAIDTFGLRRVRVVLDGKKDDDFAFLIQPEFAGSSATIQDAALEYVAVPALSLRAGKFKVPFGLEFLQIDPYMFFAERGLPTQLVPNRDVGLQAFGNLASGTVTYAVGVFNGAVDGSSSDRDNNDAKDCAARLFIHPFRLSDLERVQNLGVGMAATFGDDQGTASSPRLPSFKTSGQQVFFSYKNSTNVNGTAFADGQHVRLGPQAYWYAGPFGMLAEYVKSSQDISDGKNETALDNTAWQIQAGWVLTGEKAGYNDVTPRANFAPSKGNWGALELVGRCGALTIDSGAFSAFADASKSAASAKTWAAGMNWYLNRNVKLMLDYDQTSFDGGADNGADRPDERLLLCRAQLSF